MARKPQVRVVGDFSADPLEGLCQSARVAIAVDKMQRELVRQARDAGRSWTEIGTSLGISRQSAWERFAGG